MRVHNNPLEDRKKTLRNTALKTETFPYLGISLSHSPHPEYLTPAPHSSAIALVYTIAITYLDHGTNLTQPPILIVASFLSFFIL